MWFAGNAVADSLIIELELPHMFLGYITAAVQKLQICNLETNSSEKYKQMSHEQCTCTEFEEESMAGNHHWILQRIKSIDGRTPPNP